MSEATTPAAFWDREALASENTNWLADERVRAYVNERVSGDAGVWPLDWFERHYSGRKFENALSIGCGTGPMERDLVRRGLCRHVDAFDASTVSLEVARSEAAKLGMENQLHYYQADFNAVVLPKRKYDIVIFHQSLHHVSQMERLFRQVLRSMRPGAVLYLDEFVGPSRTYWTNRTTAPYSAIYEIFPRELRYFDHMQLPVQYEDVSEAVRSGEIQSRLAIGFRVDQFRGYGGNILAVLFPALNLRRLPPEYVERMIDMEKRLLAAGVPSFCAIIVATPKTGLARLLAHVRYFLDPKLRRLALEWRLLRGAQSRCTPEEDRFRL